jgi:hypothetical protein
MTANAMLRVFAFERKGLRANIATEFPQSAEDEVGCGSKHSLKPHLISPQNGLQGPLAFMPMLPQDDLVEQGRATEPPKSLALAVEPGSYSFKRQLRFDCLG